MDNGRNDMYAVCDVKDEQLRKTVDVRGVEIQKERWDRYQQRYSAASGRVEEDGGSGDEDDCIYA